MGKVIGIDLGTTNSCVAIMEGGVPVVISNEEGDRTTPSVVAYTKEDEQLVGKVAKRQAITNAESTVYSIKRFMGRRFNEVAAERKLVPYQVTEAPDGTCRVEIDGKSYAPPEIFAHVLMKLKQSAEEHLHEPVTEAVITVPAYYNDAQRQATKDAGLIAGLDVKRIINEPTAAAIAYGLLKRSSEKIAVFDFGGGTFDISILQVGDDVVQVLGSNGDTQLGGDNIDDRIVAWLLREFQTESGIDVSGDKVTLQRLKGVAEATKIELSTARKREVNLPFFASDKNGPRHLVRELTRVALEQMITDLIERSLERTKKCLADVNLKPSDIDQIVLVGGTTRIPKVQEAVRAFFGREPNKTVNPDEVVAMGAAIQGGVLSGQVNDLLLLDVTPLSLGVETRGGVMTKLIERNTTIPIRESRVFSTATDGVTKVEIHVLQGEREMARDNRSLGRFVLSGIPAAPRGIAQIEVTFDIDSNGIVNVLAKEEASDKPVTLQITSSNDMGRADVERMVRDAREQELKDKQRRHKAELRNKAEALVQQADHFVADNLVRLGPAAESLRKACDAVRQAFKESKGDEIEAAVQALETQLYATGEALYQKSA